MDAEHRDNFDRLQDLAADDNFNPGNHPASNTISMDGVLDGSERIELSHAGGEFGSLEQDIEEDAEEDEEKAR